MDWADEKTREIWLAYFGCEPGCIPDDDGGYRANSHFHEKIAAALRAAYERGRADEYYALEVEAKE